MKHTGPKPAGQPRTLRSVAEQKSAPASFPDEVPQDTAGGVPSSDRTFGQKYDDRAEAVKPKSGGVRASTAADKKPFKGG